MGLSLFSQTNPALIGLDIAASSIKIVELSGSKGRIRLERYAIEPLPKGAIIDGNIELQRLGAMKGRRRSKRARDEDGAYLCTDDGVILGAA